MHKLSIQQQVYDYYKLFYSVSKAPECIRIHKQLCASSKSQTLAAIPFLDNTRILHTLHTLLLQRMCVCVCVCVFVCVCGGGGYKSISGKWVNCIHIAIAKVEMIPRMTKAIFWAKSRMKECHTWFTSYSAATEDGCIPNKTFQVSTTAHSQMTRNIS